jgi:hypothetical protein
VGLVVLVVIVRGWGKQPQDGFAGGGVTPIQVIGE